MKISIGSDHAGFKAKKVLVKKLNEVYEIIDCGTMSEDPVDYPDYASRVTEAVASGNADKGILICGTGIGMCMAANKERGIRAALCYDMETAKLSRLHNDANVLCMGARILDAGRMVRIAKVWMETDFEGKRHKTRVDKIMNMER